MERKPPFHLYGTTPDAPDAPATDYVSPNLMNRLIIIALIVVAIVTFQEWHRQQTVQENVALRTALDERNAAIALITGEGGVAETIVQRLKAEVGVHRRGRPPVPAPMVVIPPRTQPTRRGKPNPKLSGQAEGKVYSGGAGFSPAADWR